MSRKQDTSQEDIVTSIRLPRDLHEQVQEKGKREDRTLAAQIRVAIQEHLERAAA